MRRLLYTVIYIAFMLTGVVTTLLGPLIPILSVRWSLEDRQAGYLFTAQFTGSTAAVMTVGRLIARFGFARSLVIGLSIMAAGVAAVPIGVWWIGVAAVFCYGTALGITIPTTNLMISEQNPMRRAAALNLLNFAWSLGAVTGPPIIALLAPGGITLPMIALSATLGLAAIALARLSKIDTAEKEALPTQSAGVASTWRNWLTLLIGVLTFLYVGTENSIAGWVASYALRLDPVRKSLWAFVPSGFWLAILLGRAIAPAILRHMPDDRLLLIGLLSATCGAALILAATTLPSLLIAVFIAGLGLAPVFPIVLAIMSQRLGASASKAAGAIFALAGFGGATMPWIVGLLSTHFASLRAGLIVPLASGLAMICLQALLKKL
jgi:FHS family glucose/mannose:H+ symporter-like MFS transporter